MSHFQVLVITEGEPDQEALTNALQPFHEFECTGTDDEYVQDIDRTDEVRAEWAERCADGDAEERTFSEWVEGWYGGHVYQQGEEIDTSDPHSQYGYHVVNANGELVKSVDRTNPNRKWDWWVVGGRFGGPFLPINREEPIAVGEGGLGGRNPRVAQGGVDQCRRGNLALDQMREANVSRRRQAWLNAVEKIIEKDSSLDEDRIRLIWAVFASNVDEWTEKWKAAENSGRRWDWWKEHATGEFREVLDTPVVNVICDMFFGPGVPENQVDIDAWFEAAAPIGTYAILDTEGNWHQKGEMGWFGMSSDEMTDAEWQAHIEKLITELPEDHWLTAVDCHI